MVTETPTIDPVRAGEKALIVSSDGHASAEMEDYRPYLPASWHEEFDAFCLEYRQRHTRPFRTQMDPDVVAYWDEHVIDAGRLEGVGDPKRRLAELAREGVAAEVLFPDTTLPFQLYSTALAALNGFERTPAQVEVANRAYNRWLADFCQAAPEQFVGLAVVEFDDVDAAINEIRWAKEHGLRGVVLPAFDDARPVFDPDFDRLWSELADLELPVNSHVAISSITRRVPTGMLVRAPHPGVVRPLYTAQIFFFAQQLLMHMVWGGVLERHPTLQLVLTEQGSGWVVGALEGMDYTYKGSYLRRDVREVVKQKPSDYFRRQCHIGSSLFSQSEAEARHQIGVDKIAIGTDYPHFEGTWGMGPGTPDYLRATLGAAHVPPTEARMMLGENAARVWGIDLAAIRPIADEIGPDLALVLTPPDVEHYPRGDVHKPLRTQI
jgi:predicted TIM-barrel fold metal-dependent hydrolase